MFLIRPLICVKIRKNGGGNCCDFHRRLPVCYYNHALAPFQSFSGGLQHFYQKWHRNGVNINCTGFHPTTYLGATLPLLTHPHTHLVQPSIAPCKIRDCAQGHRLHLRRLLTVELVASGVGEPLSSDVEQCHAA